VLRAARCKCRTQKSRQKSPSGHHPTTLSGYIFATKACINNLKNLLSSNISSTCPHNMVIFGPLVLSFSFFFFLALSQPPQIGCLPYFHTWCGLSANLRCRSETCCSWLAENTGRKKVGKNRHLGSIVQLCWAVSSQRRHVSIIGKKTC